MRNWKKAAVSVLVAGMVLQFTACGEKGGKQGEMPKKTTSSTQSTEPAESSTSTEPAQSSTSTESEKPAETKQATYPVQISNYNHDRVYEKAPERIFAMDLNASTTLTALGLKDKIIASRVAGLQLSQIDEKYRKEVGEISLPKEVSEGIPTLENILALNPDFILMDSFYFNIPTFGTYEDYEKNGIGILVTEGTQVPKPTIENIYNDIMNLGKIFGVEDRAEVLVDELKLKTGIILAKRTGKESVKLMGLDNMKDGKVFVSGGSGMENALFEAVGCENVFKDIEKQFDQVSFEEVLARDPDYIVLHAYPEDPTAAETIKQIKENPELKELKAVKGERFIVVPLSYIFSGLHNINELELLVEGLSK